MVTDPDAAADLSEDGSSDDDYGSDGGECIYHRVIYHPAIRCHHIGDAQRSLCTITQLITND